MKIRPLKINKKAQVSPETGTFSIFTFMIVAFLAVVLFAGLIWTMGLINNVMHQVGVQNDATNSGSAMYVNMTQASDSIFGQVNSSIQALTMVAVVYILGEAVIIIVTNALQKKHPIFFFAYVLIALLAVLFAPTISNAYITLLNSGMMDGVLNKFVAANFLLINLPTIVMIISTVGAVFLFINLIRGGGDSSL